MEKYAATISIIGAVVSCVFAALNWWDRVSERTPVAYDSGIGIRVMNPRKKTIMITDVYYYGKNLQTPFARDCFGEVVEYKTSNKYHYTKNVPIKPGEEYGFNFIIDGIEGRDKKISIKSHAFCGWKYYVIIDVFPKNKE